MEKTLKQIAVELEKIVTQLEQGLPVEQDFLVLSKKLDMVLLELI